jgi:AmpE protein
MVFLITIVVSLVLQYFLCLRSEKLQVNWVKPYFDLVATRFPKLVNLNSELNGVILFLPVAIVVTLLYMALAWVFQKVDIVIYILNLFLFWYFTDFEKFTEQDATEHTPESLLHKRIQYLFAPLFWCALLPGFFVLFYYVIFRQFDSYQRQVLGEENGFAEKNLPLYILNWIPVRLLGFSFAVVGNFQPLIAKWRANFFARISHVEFLAEILSCSIVKSDEVDNSEGLGVSGRVDTIESQRLSFNALLVWLGLLLLVALAVLFR